MGLFRRRPASDDAFDGEPDETFPFLTAPAAAALRSEAAAAFAERGLEMLVFADHLVDDAGREFGLYNLAAACHGDERGPSAWPELVREHVRKVLEGLDAVDVIESMSDDELRERVFPRLHERAGLPPERVPGHAVDFSDDVVELFNLDLPETVILLDDATVDRLGGRGRLRPLALDHLRAGLADLAIQRFRTDAATIDVVSGDSMFAASSVLVLPDLLEHFELGPAPHGVVVAMPFRHQVLLHVIRDASVVESLSGLVSVAINGFGDGVGPLSPHAYWWHDGVFEQLTHLEGDTMSIHVGPAFQQVLEGVVEES